MGLEVKPEVAAAAVAAQPQEKPPEATVLLELAIYQRYTRQGQLYVAKTDLGQPMVYRFTVSQARILMTEVDPTSGLPIWRRPRPRVTEQQRQIDLSKPVVQDVRTDRVNENAPIDRHPEELGPEQRLEDGSDEEFAELMGGELPEGNTVQI